MTNACSPEQWEAAVERLLQVRIEQGLPPGITDPTFCALAAELLFPRRSEREERT